MTDPQSPDPQNPEPHNPDPQSPDPQQAVVTMAQRFVDQNRGMDYARHTVESLRLGLLDWLSDIDRDGSGRGQVASDRSRLLGRLVDQLLTMSTLVDLSIHCRREEGDLTTGWVLLEQARQQLGWAGRTAGALRGTVAEKVGIVSEPDEDAVFADEVPPATDLVLEFLLQRDLLPRPEYASELMDMGEGVGVIPDPRPVTPFELLPLQMLSAASMQCGSVISDAMPRHPVDRMAFGTYAATLLDQAAGLLAEHAAGHRQLVRAAELGKDAADVLRQTTPGPLEVFPPHAAGPAA